jgi:hypothetical protein
MRRIIIFLFAVFFVSCFGISSDITIKNDGSGTIALEYHISQDLLKLGTLDGNESFPAVPVGENDFKRTIDRIDGLKLKKFSKKEEGNDIIYSVLIDFSNMTALIKFIDTQGQYCNVSQKDNEHILMFVFSPGNEESSSEMKELMPIIFDGYEFHFKISLPQKCNVVFFNRGEGQIDEPSVGTVNISSKSVSFNSSMADLFSTNAETAMEIRWKK